VAWVAPEFAQYPLGLQYTHWIYSDPQANPNYWDKPHKWPEAGVILFQDREIEVVLPSGTAPVETALELTGGKSCVVFARYASAAFAGDTLNQQMPTQLWAYIDFAQALVHEYWETQETPLANVFGTGWAPSVWPAPITWNDKLKRQFTLTNRSGLVEDLTVVLGWKVAFLYTGA
jgi:hypothetical protein